MRFYLQTNFMINFSNAGERSPATVPLVQQQNTVLLRQGS
nr:MAG TPA: hypothetical protein [Caudoviricetes sp.]